MIKKYEDACREAGLCEAHIKKIRQIFDAEKKRTSRRKSAIEREGFAFFPISYLEADNGEDREKEFDAAADYDLEEDAIKHYLLEELEKNLALLDPEDREFILMCYDPSFCETRYANQIGVARHTIQSRKRKIVSLLREKIMKL